MMTSKEVVKKYLGIPYRHKGRDPKVGLDCWGLGICVFKDLGINLLDFEVDYSEDWAFENNFFIENYYKEWEIVKVPRVFDCVLFKFYSNASPNHGGICLGENKFIHACKQGVVVADLGRASIKDLTVGFFRHKDMK